MFPRELVGSDACVGVQAVKSSADPSTEELGYNTLSNPFFDKNLAQGSYFTTSLLSCYIALKIRVLKGCAVNHVLCSPSFLGLLIQHMMELHRERRPQFYFFNITACCGNSPALSETTMGAQHV